VGRKGGGEGERERRRKRGGGREGGGGERKRERARQRKRKERRERKTKREERGRGREKREEGGKGGLRLSLEQPVCRAKINIQAFQSFRGYLWRRSCTSSAPYSVVPGDRNHGFWPSQRVSKHT
jgi:hypothetical protein